MNVLFIHEVDWLGKIVFDIHSLSEALSLLGHDVYAIDFESLSSRGSIFDFGSLKTKVIDNAARANPEATIHLRRPGFIKFPGLGHPSAVFTHYLEIKNTIKEKNIEAIVLYSAATNGLQTLHLARKFNIPVVFRAIDILHQLVPFPSLRSLVKLLEKKVYAGADFLLPHTPKEAGYLTTMGAKEANIKLLALPVEMNLFHPSPESTELRQKSGLGEQDQIILFQGTLYPFSGLDLFLYQFPELLEQIPNAKLLLVGNGPQRPELERIVTQLKLHKNVVMTGFQPYDMVPGYINLATVCINPFLINSITREIFPGKIPQYLACGKPVISTALPGLMTVIEGEKQGIIYVNSISEMINELISLLKSSERRQKLSQAGLNYTRQVHSSEQVGRQLETILKEAIKDKHDGRIPERTQG
ncbi:glycosyltransferase family 4 protein [Chloroflexota bacterium]